MEETEIAIPLCDGTDFAVPLALVAELEQAYPRADVTGELRKARAWCVANPTQRKTRRGAPKFLTGWIGRASDRAGPVSDAPPPRQRRQL